MIEYLFYIISLFLIVTILLKINNFHLFDEPLIFSTATNYLLIFSTSIFYFYFKNYLFSLISSILLIFFSFLLIHDFKRILGYIPFTSIPFIITNFITLINIIINYQ